MEALNWMVVGWNPDGTGSTFGGCFMDGARFERMEPSGTRSVSMEMFDGILDGSFLDGTFGWNLDEFDGNLKLFG